jgi:hypothetical protein
MLRRWAFFLALLPLLILAPVAHAKVFADVAGIVHDPQHRPIAGAAVHLQGRDSAYSQVATTQADGSFRFLAAPFGEYTLTVSHAGFATVAEALAINPDTSPILHLQLPIGTVQETVHVNEEPDQAHVDSVTPTVTISRTEIESTPGAARSDSLAMITDYVPGAYITHDMLHMRGGHQVAWLLDGVQIPNTNIASNLGPQIDPLDIDYLQIDRGSYNADLGDRTYGIFNVNPRTGFGFHRDAVVTLTAGSALQNDDQVAFGDHTRRFAYYTSLNSNRSDYGLSPPIEQAVHDAENGYGGFGDILFNKTPSDQLRVIAQLRTDYFQIPYDPNPNDYENQLYDSSGLRDGQHETDGLAAFTWTHSFDPKTLLAVSPFYHHNSANYEPGPNDTPTATTSDRASSYSGVQASIARDAGSHHFEAGFYGWGQHDSNLFAVNFGDAAYQNFSDAENAVGGLVEEYFSDNWKVTPWLTAIGGMRESYFTEDTPSGFSENAFYPRIGLAARVPHLHWVFRAFYGHFYQPPPLETISGPVLAYAQSTNTGFAPLHGERDEEHQFGVQIPWRGWLLDADTFQTRANNFFDHSNIGESSIYFPITVDGALIQGWETTLTSPRIWQRGQLHLAYSNQIAQQRGAITGGLVCYPISSPQCDVAPGYEALDHDQRNTLNIGGSLALPAQLQASTNVYYGSGFSNGYPGPPSPFNSAYLPAHTTFDLQFRRNVGENASVAVNATNVANTRVLLDNSLTFGGFHENDPRQIYGELRYHFHF